MYSRWFMSTFPAEALPHIVCSTEGVCQAERYSIKEVRKGNTHYKNLKKSGFGGSSSLRLEDLMENDEEQSLKKQRGSRTTAWTLNYIVALWSAVGIGGLLGFLFGRGVGFGPEVGLTVEQRQSSTISWKNKERKWAWCLIMKAFSSVKSFGAYLG